jgi:hypothetical protein
VPIIKLPEPYSVTLARHSVNDSLMAHGEECVLLSTYHPSDGDGMTCPNCSDDIYDSGSNTCTYCFGTGYSGGVRYARRVWGLFSDHRADENYSARGTWAPDAREFQTEAFPLLLEHDFVVRVRHWDTNHIPLELEGYYGIGQVIRNSLRTGNRFGQFYWDVVGQRASITKLQTNDAICNYPVLGVAFPDIGVGGVSTVLPPVVAPDTKVIYYTPPTNEYSVVIGDGTTSVYPVVHHLGTTSVVVAVYEVSTGELVDVDTFVTDANTVTFRFGVAPAPGSCRVVIRG